MLAIILSIIAVIVSSVALFRVYQTRPLGHVHDFKWHVDKFTKTIVGKGYEEWMINVGTCKSCGFTDYRRIYANG